MLRMLAGQFESVVVGTDDPLLVIAAKTGGMRPTTVIRD